MEGTPFHINDFISHARFRKNLTDLTYNDESNPLFVDKFWEARYMIRAWKDHTKGNFFPSWVNCIDLYNVNLVQQTDVAGVGILFAQALSPCKSVLQHILGSKLDNV